MADHPPCAPARCFSRSRRSALVRRRTLAFLSRPTGTPPHSGGARAELEHLRERRPCAARPGWPAPGSATRQFLLSFRSGDLGPGVDPMEHPRLAVPRYSDARTIVSPRIARPAPQSVDRCLPREPPSRLTPMSHSIRPASAPSASADSPCPEPFRHGCARASMTSRLAGSESSVALIWFPKA
ncbi:skin secretory protein xP2 [Iris pallida]|uniref:Skin secretory protein xP2 n=1 Tax=Iris pallida TaxID=29817 RepID=A0AAX6G385_IRIPA|nr:skin secretory protein xP2 [Iris pallida]